MLENKVIVITGGSKGLGLSAAQALVAMGAKVALMARSQEALDTAAAALGEGHIGVAVDVADQAAVQAAFAKVHQHFGRIDGLVNNAGLARPNAIEHLPAEDLMLQINTNFVGLVYCSQAAIPYLREQKDAEGSLIVNISSATVHHDNEMSHLSIYAATKAAVETFSRELRHEVTADGIGVTVLVPGAAESEFGAGFDFDKLSVALKAWLEKGPLFDGTMKSESIGQAIAHCFTYPKGVTVDFIEVKPHKPTPKPVF